MISGVVGVEVVGVVRGVSHEGVCRSRLRIRQAWTSGLELCDVPVVLSFNRATANVRKSLAGIPKLLLSASSKGDRTVYGSLTLIKEGDFTEVDDSLSV